MLADPQDRFGIELKTSATSPDARDMIKTLLIANIFPEADFTT
jgi:hypothetical protein